MGKDQNTGATAEFLMGLETECLTALEGFSDPEDRDLALRRFFTTVSQVAPWLPGPSGIFNPYGRVHVEVNRHVEIATAEADSPELLATLVEQQQTLVGRAVEAASPCGKRLILANNNHDGLLRPGTATWGAHENYLVERHPNTFADQILPFLVTRVYAGAGGVTYPSGQFVAGVRAQFAVQDVGGGTTHHRAIHSTARDEHHMGPRPSRYRYHLILGDGHRSQFSLVLQFGATALALKAIFFNPNLVTQIPELCGSRRSAFWVAALRKFNVLAEAGSPPRVHPLVLQVQRIYLDGACRYADSLPVLPDWVPRVLTDWRMTLDALERDDQAWLAARLDPWIKYRLYCAVLRDMKATFADLPKRDWLFDELALLDQNYHEFINPKSVFAELERAGAIQHRVLRPIAPGDEAEPYVPQTATRARARARLIREAQGTSHLIMDWSAVYDQRRHRYRTLEDPFAPQYSPWQPTGSAARPFWESTIGFLERSWAH